MAQTGTLKIRLDVDRTQLDRALKDADALMRLDGQQVQRDDWNTLVARVAALEPQRPDASLAGVAALGAVATASTRPITRRALLGFWRR